MNNIGILTWILTPGGRCPGRLFLGTGCWILVTGCWMLVSGCSPPLYGLDTWF